MTPGGEPIPEFFFETGPSGGTTPPAPHADQPRPARPPDSARQPSPNREPRRAVAADATVRPTTRPPAAPDTPIVLILGDDGTILPDRFRDGVPVAPVPVVPDERKSWTLASVVAVAFGLVMLIGVVGLGIGRNQSKPKNGAGTQGAVVPPGGSPATSPPPASNLIAPAGVTAVAIPGGQYELHWTDPNPASPPHRPVVLVSARTVSGGPGTLIGASESGIILTPGVGYSAQLTKAGAGAALTDPGGYCFSVGFYDASASAISSAVLVQSQPVCATPSLP